MSSSMTSYIDCAAVYSVLHDQRLAHTDLKPENILFVSSDYEYSETKRIHHKAS